MHKTIYIDTEEEIIGIINKIRDEEASDIFLVVPKNSLLIQGIINLKILKKEVDKMGKKIILVTSDKCSKTIVSKVGLKTKNKSVEDFVEEEGEVPQKNSLEKEDLPKKEIPTPRNPQRKIGSLDFYESTATEDQKKEAGVFPENQPKEELPTKNLRIKKTNDFGEKHIKNYKAKKEVQSKNKLADFSFKKPFNKNHKTSIDDFYKEEERYPEKKDAFKKKKEKKRFSLGGKKGILLMGSLLTIALLIYSGFVLLKKWPKLEIELFLKNETREATTDFMVCTNKNEKQDCLKGNYQELEIEITENYDSTGEKFSNNKGMARGIVKIYNNYSSRPQPLVATTRLLSKEGKLFRLIDGVTVPGMEENKAGSVEAQVIADEIGRDYNLDSTEFTIEGFKGGEKYKKFKVVSENSMTGGANDTDNKRVKVVTEQDIARAREKTIEIFNQKLKENIQAKLKAASSFVPTSISKNIIYSDSSYTPGDIINKFNYTVIEKIKVITFNETGFREIIQNSFQGENLGNLEFEKINRFEFTKDMANYENQTLDLSVEAQALYWPIIKKEDVKKNLSQKRGNQLKNYLSNLDGIKKAVLFYSPPWLSSWPIKNDNINIKITRK